MSAKNDGRFFRNRLRPARSTGWWWWFFDNRITRAVWVQPRFARIPHSRGHDSREFPKIPDLEEPSLRSFWPNPRPHLELAATPIETSQRDRELGRVAGALALSHSLSFTGAA